MTQTNVKKSSTGGATLYGGGNSLRGGQLFGGGNDFALRGGGQGGLREILSFENLYSSLNFSELRQLKSSFILSFVHFRQKNFNRGA